ncbi:MAG: 16S rRNA (guanine(966)-N(2))-methyltransferase RsmD [Gammaproteobacteria bacterium]|jgi:16S rRNA (guanine966-N2)-methyltransferase|nr:16S rRNA (guanine(966)-N(2))-methyltransferase RsmD [Gammaproteobacteria bacterium]
MTIKPGAANKKPRPGRLRIVAGKWRSRLLDIAEVPGLRPTSERVRETLFNWLAPSIQGARCLDLFAGTGALGFEALSRGATSVIFVENSRRAAKAIEKSAQILDASGAVIHCGDAAEYVRNAQPASFDILFLDPPFADDRLEALCRQIDEHGILAPGGRVYLEQDRAKPETPLPDRWRVQKNKTAGKVRYMLVEVGS